MCITGPVCTLVNTLQHFSVFANCTDFAENASMLRLKHTKGIRGGLGAADPKNW